MIKRPVLFNDFLLQTLTKRKIAGGSRSFSGFVDTARLLTVIQ
ncbi:hypothetical protein [Microcystis aeruginosa]|nr:hypothetical protein [Microcystis aeruginosa]